MIGTNTSPIDLAPNGRSPVFGEESEVTHPTGANRQSVSCTPGKRLPPWLTPEGRFSRLVLVQRPAHARETDEARGSVLRVAGPLQQYVRLECLRSFLSPYSMLMVAATCIIPWPN